MAARLTTYLVVAIVAATLIAGLIVGAQRDDNSGPVDLIVHNAKVYAADDAGTMAEAVAVRGNKILHVGGNREILRYRRPQTTVIDAKGAAVLPGFNDAHTSLIAGGLSREVIDLSDASTLESMQERLAAAPTSDWVVARGWTYDRFADLPTRAHFDAAVSDRPGVAFSLDGHAAWLNTKALEAAGIAKRTTVPRNGVIVRDARGEPTGLVKDGAIALVTRAMPPSAREARARALRLAIRDAHEHGVTSVQTFGESADDLDVYDEARRAGELTVRVYLTLPVSAPLAPADLSVLDETGKRFFDDPLLKTGAASIAVDGSVTSYTAALLKPYATHASSSGLAYLEPDELNDVVATLDARGVQVAADAAGDRAVRMALDAFEAAALHNASPARQRRHRIERVEIVDPDDLPRFKKLRLVAALQPFYATPDRLHAWGRNLGPDRAPLGWPARSLAAAGAHLTFGTDWPNLPMDPLAGLSAAIARTATTESAEEVPAIDESLPLKSAINAWTSGAAWASFDDHRKGTIKPGMLADLVVLSTNIFDPKTRSLAATAVDVTIFDGKVVYRRKAS